MKNYKIEFRNGRVEFITAENIKEVVKRLDLCTKENIETKVTELEK